MRYLVYVLLGVVLSGAVVIGIQYWHNEHLETDIAQANANIDQLTQDNNAFKAALAKQAMAIKTLEAETKVKQAQAEQASQKADQMAAVANNLQARIDSTHLSGDQCKDTFNLIDEFVKR